MVATVREARVLEAFNFEGTFIVRKRGERLRGASAIRTRDSTFVQALSRYTVSIKYETVSEKVSASHPSGVDVVVL